MFITHCNICGEVIKSVHDHSRAKVTHMACLKKSVDESRKMKLSEKIKSFGMPRDASSPLKMETRTDADALIFTIADVERIIAEVGDVEVLWHMSDRIFLVPEFKEDRERFIAAKLKECARWGSN